MKIKYRRILSILLSVNLGLSAAGILSGFPVCAAAGSTSTEVDQDQEIGTVTVGQLLEANDRAQLCNQHDCYSIHTVNWLADESKEEVDRYVSAEQLVVDDDYVTEVVNGGQGDVYGYDKEQKKGFRYLFMKDGYKDFLLHNPSVDGFTATGKETFYIDDTAPQGELAVTAIVSDLSEYDAEYFDKFGYSKNDIKTMKVNYIFDKESNETKKMDSFIELKDGNTVDLSSSVFTYGGEKYETAKSISDVISGNDTRTLTLIADPGTSKEATYTQTAQKGNMIIFYAFNGYTDLFSDSACEKEYVSSDADDQKDITVYTTVK